MKFATDKELQDLVNKKAPYSVQDCGHGSCSNGSDNQGSTGYEIFSNGVSLGLAAANSGYGNRHTDGEVKVFCFDIFNGDVSVFFIGTRDEVKTLIEGCDNKEES